MNTNHWRELFDAARHENGKNNVPRAEEYFSLAIQAAEQLPKNTRSYSSSQGSFALWQYAHEQFAAAEVFQQRYIEAEIRLGVEHRELGNLLLLLAEIQKKQGKLDVAKTTIEHAITTYPDGCLPELSAAHQALSDVLNDMGEITPAHQCRKIAIQLQNEWDKELAERMREFNT